jgi:3'(2'), 5'-bisphosphate nucleotidase
MSPTDPDAVAGALRQIAEGAGVGLKAHQAAGCPTRLKDDGSPVTQADIESEAFILAALARQFPDIAVISEENAASHTLATPPRYFLVDPLDGTRAFIEGRPDYAVLIAYVEKGIPLAGVVHVPAQGLSWWAGRQAHAASAGGATRRLTPLAQRFKAPRGVISAHHAVGESHALCARLGIDIAHVENSALKFGRLAEGEVDCYPRPGRTMQWDVAAGDALLRALGGGVFMLDGQRLPYGAGALGWANPAFIAWRDVRDVRAIRDPDSA